MAALYCHSFPLHTVLCVFLMVSGHDIVVHTCDFGGLGNRFGVDSCIEQMHHGTRVAMGMQVHMWGA